MTFRHQVVLFEKSSKNQFAVIPLLVQVTDVYYSVVNTSKIVSQAEAGNLQNASFLNAVVKVRKLLTLFS